MARTTTRQVRSLPTIPIAEVSNPLSFVIYGRSGTGKTTIASTFPTPILYCDIRDRGTDSIRDVKGIDAMKVQVWEDYEDVYYYLKTNPNHGYKTIVIDTITQLQQMAMTYVLSNKKKNTQNVGDWGTMTKREWGDAAAIMKDWIDNFVDLPVDNVVFLAQERADKPSEEDDDNLLIPEVGPRTMPSVASALNANVSVIGNTFIRIKRTKKEINGKKVTREKAVYCLRVGPNPIYTTKIRKPRHIEAPDYIEDPTYDDIMDVIEGAF